MTREEKKKIILDALKIQYLNIEQNLRCTQYFVESYIKCRKNYGENSDITKKVANYWREFQINMKEERLLIFYLVKNSHSINYESAIDFLNSLDSLNEKNICFYYDFLDAVDDECDINNNNIEFLPKKNFHNLADTDFYHQKLAELSLTENDLKVFFSFQEDFWNYINKRTLHADLYHDDIQICGVIPKINERGILTDLKLITPNIIDLETACYNLDLYRIAFEYYQNLNKKYEEIDIHDILENNKQEFKNKYVKHIIKPYYKK